jgi:membrane protease YdiL (CAAX protease family)
MEEIQDAMVTDAMPVTQESAIQKRQYNTIIIAGICIATLFHQVAGPYFIIKGMPPVSRLIISDLLMWGTLPLLYYYAKNVEGRDFFLWKERPKKLWFYVAAIVGLFILTACASRIASIPRLLGFHDNYTIMRYWQAIIKNNKPMIFFTCLTAGFTEELQIRAYVLPRLYMLFKSSYLPIIISALIFSFLHLGYGNLSECIFTFGFGLICGLFYEKFQNIQILIIFHFLFDMFAFGFFR